MDLVENIRVRKERAEAGLCTEQDCPPAVTGMRIEGRVGIMKDSSTEGDEVPLTMFLPRRQGWVRFSHQINDEIASMLQGSL